MNRLTLMKLHLLLAAFMFPVALMFLVTGGLYTWGYKGSYVSEVYDVELQAPLPDNQAALTAIVETELARLSLDNPSGGAKVKSIGSAFQLEWTGAARDVILDATADPLVAKLTVKETTWYRNLVQLHKAKGGQLFKIYAAALAISLFLILSSGFILAWQVPKLRKTAAIFAGSGVLLFGALVLLS